MSDYEIPAGQAAKIVGIPADIMKRLCEEAVVPSRKGKAGHFYVKLNDLPERAVVLERMRAEHLAHLAKAKAAVERARSEVEAVALDLQEALDDPTMIAPLGNDLRQSYGSGALRESFNALMDAAMHVIWSNRHLQELEAAAPSNG